MTLDKYEPQFPQLKDVSWPSPFHRSDNTLKGRRQRTKSSSINAQYDPTTLGLSRANQPEMGKVTSSSKSPRKLMRLWQRQEDQLWDTSEARAQRQSRNTNWLAGQLQAQ